MNNISAQESIFNQINALINEAKEEAVSSVNSTMVKLYWNIGSVIKNEILLREKPEYGKKIVENLSDKLVFEYGKGYGVRNLFYMIQFYEKFPDENILHTACAKLSWSHFKRLLPINDNLKREFYMTLSANERWSVRELDGRIGSQLYERTALSKLPGETISNDLKALREQRVMSTDLAFRDPYMLDFLGLKDTYNEKDLENAILAELEKFILEIGRDFTFVGRQVRITIGDEDYYIDLLFFHRKLKRLVLIELKLEKFLPEHKGQVELYLRWLEKNEMNEGELPPIGIILCAEKNHEVVELLELDKSGIHVAQYLTEILPKDVLERKLQSAIATAKLSLEQRSEISSNADR